MTIGAVIVTYNPEISKLISNIESIASQVACIVLVDNGSNNISYIADIVDKYQLLFISNRANLGIAKALNQGIELCNDNMCDWVLTLDQDSVSPSDMIKVLSQYTEDENIGMINPIVDIGYGEALPVWPKMGKYDTPITSGSLTNVNIWRKIGKFNEDLFIDQVDNEYCIRLQVYGFKIKLCDECVLHHSLGDGLHTTKFLFKEYKTFLHSPIRHFYITRNYLYIVKTYFKRDAKMLYQFFKMCVLSVALSNDRMTTLKYVLCGINAFNKSKYGEYSN